MMTQNNIIGPIPEDDWNLLLLLKGGLEKMRQNPNRYRETIEDSVELQKKYLSKYLK